MTCCASASVEGDPVGGELYASIEPYQSGMLDVGDGNLVYWEVCGFRMASRRLSSMVGRDPGAAVAYAGISILGGTASFCSTSVAVGVAFRTPVIR